MKKFLLLLIFSFAIIASSLTTVFAAEEDEVALSTSERPGLSDINMGCLALSLTGWQGDPGDIGADTPPNLMKYQCGSADNSGNVSGLLPIGGKHLATLYKIQPGLNEYLADVINNMGIPSVSRAYAQSSGGTGYQALSSFLPFWKAFRNLAYSLYIIMFVVVGIMIMLRTKINTQTVITIQAALPNLLITLLLITFSYAIVGFMIDIMYFLMYFLAYLLDTIGILDGGQAITRLLSSSAWGVIFEGRNSIISVVAEAIRQILGANTTPGYIVRGLGFILSGGITELMVNALPYLLVAVWLAVTMVKLIWLLTKSYLMLIIQTVTAPMQILMNAMPGSKAFSEWLKKTASYLLPFPVAAAMFLVAAMFIGNPTNATKLGGLSQKTGIDQIAPQDGNPFGIDESNEFYQKWDENGVWMPPFTIDFGWEAWDIMILLGFFIFTMTPAAVQMSMDWLQVKESPYTSEIGAGFGTAKGLMSYPTQLIQSTKKQQEQINLAKQQARWNAEEFKKVQGS